MQGGFDMSDKHQNIWLEIEYNKAKLHWGRVGGNARKWWNTFENENLDRPKLVHKVTEELANRKSSIGEYFLAYCYSDTDIIQENLDFLDAARELAGEGMPLTSHDFMAVRGLH